MTNKDLQDCIIFQDSYLLVVNKPAGISAQDDHIQGQSFHALLEEFCKKTLYVVHRIDRPASGVMVFAKKKGEAGRLSTLFKDEKSNLNKKYIVAVRNTPKKPEGQLTHYLIHDKKQRKSLVVSSDDQGGKKATLTYRKIAEIDNYALLEVDLHSGRFHQIRAQLGAIGSPVKGDVKYGARRGNKDRSIHLHSWKLNIPVADKKMSFIASVSDDDPVWKAFNELEPELGMNKYELWKEELM